jgi:copper(I)-binding protein
MLRRTVVAAGLLCLAVPALAQSPSVAVQNAWARATTPSQKVGGVFLTLTDHGPADRLVSATSPIGDMVELHQTVNDGGVMKMLPVTALDLPPGQPVELKPGGYHLMVMGLKQGLAMGSSFPVTLTFEKAPPVTVTVKVAAAGAAGPEMDHSMMGHGTMAMPMMMAPAKP